MATREELQANAVAPRGRYNGLTEGDGENEDERESSGDEDDRDDEDEDELHVLNSDEPKYQSEEIDKLDNKSNRNDCRASVASTSNSRPYQHPNSKPIFSVGNLSIGIAQAKLFGLLNKNGDVELPVSKPVDLQAARAKVNALSQPIEIDADALQQEYMKEAGERCDFMPRKSKEAEAAMKNSRCGYDFVSRLNDRGGFLDRIHQELQESQGGGGLGKIELQQAEEDYKARLDKLACPTCKKEQSFSEFSDKKRVCTECRVRFERLNISSGQDFERRNKEKEAKKAEKLARLEQEMYGTVGQMKPISSSHRPTSSRPPCDSSTVNYGASNNTNATTFDSNNNNNNKKNNSRSNSTRLGTSAPAQSSSLSTSRAATTAAAAATVAGVASQDLLRQLADLSAQKQAVLSASIQAAQAINTNNTIPRPLSQSLPNSNNNNKANTSSSRQPNNSNNSNINSGKLASTSRAPSDAEIAKKFNKLLAV